MNNERISSPANITLDEDWLDTSPSSDVVEPVVSRPEIVPSLVVWGPLYEREIVSLSASYQDEHDAIPMYVGDSGKFVLIGYIEMSVSRLLRLRFLRHKCSIFTPEGKEVDATSPSTIEAMLKVI